MLGSFLNGRVIIKVGDLTEEETDAIVNAANWSLLGGGGVDGAIHHKGGPQILEECKIIRKNDLPDGLPTGEAVITSGGNLAARHVVHTVGPIYGSNGGRDAELLANCYLNSILLAAQNDLKTVAFPSISTGAFGYPKHEAARVASAAITEAINANITITEVRLVFYSVSDANIFFKHCVF